MTQNSNLACKIESQLPAELANFIRAAGEIAQSRGQRLYLVGGVVRDLLLGRSNFDLDLVIEGDAIELARHLAEMKPGKSPFTPTSTQLNSNGKSGALTSPPPAPRLMPNLELCPQ